MMTPQEKECAEEHQSKNLPTCPRFAQDTTNAIGGPSKRMHPASVASFASLSRPYFLPRHPLDKAEGRCVTFKPDFHQAKARGSLDTTNTLDCEHFASCSGCTIADAIQPQIFSEARNFFKKVKHPEEVQLFLGPQHGWRCRARLAVRGNAGDIKIGLFRAGSHDVVDIPNCRYLLGLSVHLSAAPSESSPEWTVCIPRIHHPRINKAIDLIRQVANTLQIPPYDELDGKGKLRYVQLTAAGTDPGAPNAHLDPYACIQVGVLRCLIVKNWWASAGKHFNLIYRWCWSGMVQQKIACC